MVLATKQLEFSLIRYMPDVVKGEFVNIGVVVLDGDATHIRFTKDWRHVRALDPAADIETLQALEEDMNAQLTHGVLDRAALLTKLHDYLSNGIELTAAQGVLAEDAATEVETLARMYLERRRASVRETSGRAAVFSEMKRAFEDAGVWRHMRHRIAASRYTHRGDPLRIDCGYRPNGVIKLFQAVSLENDTDAAKILAFSYPELRDGIRRAENARTELTAVVEPGVAGNDDQIAFALSVFARSEIRTVTTADMPEVARQARAELRL